MSKVTAKFILIEETRRNWTGGGTTVKFQAVAAANHEGNWSEEDKAFWLATPQGTLEMLVKNQTALEHFELGKAYYVTLEAEEHTD